jgi:UDP-glucose 4-epimerase
MGAGGYIGARLTRTLLDRGLLVHALVREPAPWIEVEQTVCELTVADVGALAAACEGAATVVHLAGENEVVAATRPAAVLAATVVATEKVAEACALAGVRRLLYTSTVHVYGARIESGATLEEDMRAEPRSAYAISRLASEHVAASASGDCELVVLRLTNAVGAPIDPRIDRWSLVANDLCRQGALRERLVLRSTGTQWRDFVPLTDVCEAIATAAAPSGPVPPGTYNVGSGRPITVRDLVDLIQNAFERATGRRPALAAPDPEPDPPAPYRVSVERAARYGVRLETPLERAVADTVDFCLTHREELPVG